MNIIMRVKRIIFFQEKVYSDNGTLRMVQAGDVTFTPDGKGHGLTNSGDEDLVFMALIILD